MGLRDLAEKYNPYIQGWINYFGAFYGSRLSSILHRIDAFLIRWVRRKFRRLQRRLKGAKDWLARVRQADPTLFAHWRFANADGRTSGAV
jgi:hypothetical protein